MEAEQAARQQKANRNRSAAMAGNQNVAKENGRPSGDGQLKGKGHPGNYAARLTDRRYSASAAISTSLVVTLLRSAHIATSDHTSTGTPAAAFLPIIFRNDLEACLDLGMR
jgi:hypothetical protein